MQTSESDKSFWEIYRGVGREGRASERKREREREREREIEKRKRERGERRKRE